MDIIRKLFSRLRIRSLYIKWILTFTGLIIFAQFFTFMLSMRYIIPEFVHNLDTKLYRKAEYLQKLHNNGYEIDDGILADIGDSDIHFYLLNSDEEPIDIGRYTDIISLSMLRRAAGGEIVSSHSDSSILNMPFCIVGLGDQIALLTPNLLNNELTSFFKGFQKSMTMGAVIGSIFIVLALIVIIRPIKKVTAATREVAKGNFNVELNTRSIDEVGQLIENFNLMTAELQKNEYLKKDFVSSVSHEFKTPITSIEGFVRLLKNDDLSREQLNEYTDIIIRETGRLSNLSANLLRLCILDSTGFEPDKNAYYLDEQIRNVVLLLESQWTEKNIDLNIEMDEVLFRGNEELLSQVWINIIQNAVKFSPSGGTITITLNADGEDVVVTIADQGMGILPEHGDKIFDRFYKTDKSRSKEGNGLGLSIVKKIMEISHGNISFTSYIGKGTEFTVRLPNKEWRNN